MGKIKCAISCPLDCYAGYGGRARDFIKELLKKYPNWDVEILSQRWGNCRMGYLEDHYESELLSHIVTKLNEKPDIWIQITVPNEFQAVGKYNIGVTAAIETTACDVSWIEGCNRMDLVLVSSKHGEFSLQNARYKNNRTGALIEVTAPIEVLFEGVDLEKYRVLEKSSSILESVGSSWNFLVVGHWMQGNLGHDRKNIGLTVKCFLETFKDYEGPGKAPGLILKTSRASSSATDQKEILSRIYSIQETVKYKKSLPDIYLLHGDLTDEEMNEVYNDPKVKVLVSFTKGEGYGRPLAEFAAIGKPILCSGWSGQVDFLKKEFVAFVGGTLEKVDPSAVVDHVIIPESSWFAPNIDHIQAGFKELYRQYEHWSKKAAEEKKIIRKQFSISKMGQKLKEVFDRHIPVFPERVELNLPDINEML